jgi:hypothetical protein
MVLSIVTRKQGFNYDIECEVSKTFTVRCYSVYMYLKTKKTNVYVTLSNFIAVLLLRINKSL